MARGWKAVGLGALALAAAVVVISMSQIGCGGSSTSSTSLPTPTPVPTRSVLAVAISPDPVVAQPSGDDAFPWMITYSVTVNETGGLACNINRALFRYRSKATGAELDGGILDPNAFIDGTGSNFIAALTSKTFLLRTVYGLDAGKEMTAILTIEAIDANGNVVTGTTEVEVVKHAVGGA
jgi:hypothetical protein